MTRVLLVGLGAAPPGAEEEGLLGDLLEEFVVRFAVHHDVALVFVGGSRSDQEMADLVLGVSSRRGLALDTAAEITVRSGHVSDHPEGFLLIDLADPPAAGALHRAAQVLDEVQRAVVRVVAVTPVMDRADWAAGARRTQGLRHLVSDNASQDGTPDLLEAHGFTVVRHARPVARIASWQRAVDAFLADEGDHLTWLFAGDRLLPGAARLLDDAAALVPEAGLIITEYLIDHGDGRTESWSILPSTTLVSPAEALEMSARRGNWFGAPIAHTFSRQALEHLRFGEEPWVADWQACLSVAQRFPVLYVAERAGVFDAASRQHFQRDSTTLHALVQESEVRLRSATLLRDSGGADVVAGVVGDVESALAARLTAHDRPARTEPDSGTGWRTGPVIAVHHPRAGGGERDIHGYVAHFCEGASIAYLPALARDPRLAAGLGVVDGVVPSPGGDLEVVTTPEELRARAEVLVGFEGRPYLEHLAPPRAFTGLKAYHVMDFVFHATAAGDALRDGGADLLLGYARHDVHSPFFRHAYPGFSGRVVGVPFGAGARFQPRTGLASRAPLAIGLGAVNPVDDPLCPPGELDDYVAFHAGRTWTHAWRHELVRRRQDLREVLDSKFPVEPLTKDTTPDAAAALAGAQLFVNDEGLMAFPPARTYEGLASGTVMVAGEHPVWGELGLVHGVNAVFHRPGDVEDFRRAVHEAVREPDQLSRIAGAGQALVEARYRHPVIAASLRSSLLAVLSGGVAVLPAG